MGNIQLVKGLDARKCRDCYELITPNESGEFRDDYNSPTCRGGIRKGKAHRIHTVDDPWDAHFGKYNGELAEVLEMLYMSGDSDEDFGECDTFGHFALFRECRSIMYTNSQGFVHAVTFDSDHECESMWSLTEGAYEVSLVEAELI